MLAICSMLWHTYYKIGTCYHWRSKAELLKRQIKVKHKCYMVWYACICCIVVHCL